MDEYEEGACEWFGSGGQSYGYIRKEGGGQVYVHYKNITKINQRDPKFRELRKNDKVRYKNGPGYNNTGTQALEVEILEYGDSDD